jgi:hypothetical protein
MTANACFWSREAVVFYFTMFIPSSAQQYKADVLPSSNVEVKNLFAAIPPLFFSASNTQCPE